jgi:hypothetical protein
VRVRLGPIEVPDSEALRQLIDPSTNYLRVMASRPAMAEVDWGGLSLVSTGPDVYAPTAYSATFSLSTAAPI